MDYLHDILFKWLLLDKAFCATKASDELEVGISSLEPWLLEFLCLTAPTLAY